MAKYNKISCLFKFYKVFERKKKHFKLSQKLYYVILYNIYIYISLVLYWN